MQCNWQPLARLAFRGFARPWPPSRTIHTSLKTTPPPWPTVSKTPLHSPSSFRLLTHRRLSSAVQLSHSSKFTTPPPPEILNINTDRTKALDPTEPSFTPAEVGRSAAQAVRQSVREGNFPDALIIVRSLYYARLGPGGIRTSEPVRRFLTEIESSPIPFNRAVSPRLPAHALLHALVRRGEHQNAAKLAQQMLESGTNVRSASMAAVLRGLRDAALNSPPTVLEPIAPLPRPGASRMQPHMRGNAELTGAALMLVQAARGARQRSTRRMYRYLITLCIINGEIILGSLVFGVMLREWQARQQAEIAIPAAAPLVDAAAPPPRLCDMNELLTFINWNLSAPQTDDSSRAAFSASLQALANLAHAMDKRYLALNLESLIAAIYRCPRTKEKVWIPGKKPGSPAVQVDGYQYLHATLDRLILSLPKRDYDGGPVGSGDQSAKSGEDVIQPLNPRAYNSLLNYALRHRHALSRADIVLTRMLQHPDAHLAENMALTHNIMDRARNDWPKTTIDKMEAAIGLAPPGADVISALLDAPDAELDKHALSTQITTLVRLGQLGDIVSVLPKMLPGLYPPQTPHGTPFEESLKMKARHRESGLARAVALGPVVFSTLLHALRKLGKTGLAEDVFLYGLEAEARSFEAEGHATVLRPWCLPVQAYTTMIQVYNDERGRGKKLYVVGWGLTDDGTRIEWSQQRARVHRADLARKMIVLMYRTMMAAPSTITSRLAELDALAAQGRCTVEIARRQLEPPVPDAWFFENLVDIFIGRPADRMFPGVLKAMAEHGFEMSARAARVLRETWGEDTVREVLAARPEGECVARNMRPVGMSSEIREGGARVKLGWKQWAMKKVPLSKEEEKII
ncbi:hypothetical protein HYPSUDRAFT_72861 [Hypholoma sublateritium FD-334 SS-4]|uniref:Uncharacterized protein n=1 Tax=Hypholoma sublateritium (strain FD-334 SS-4) TaxID=945553 RepID=A0A0D2KGW4_HYPSF|nr:hypothetical protein HYPSUDRAFT_72861 [Hypholoma sublateritium FD-334 SS-4]